ncbi:hypothetical protein [Colwellia sp. MEBiC06753]
MKKKKYFCNLSANDKTLHSLQHQHFIDELEQLQIEALKPGQAKNILYFLTDWLLNHILGEDKKLKQVVTTQ